MARPPRPSWLYSLVAVLSWPVLKVAFRLRATGLEHVPDGGCVVAANQWSNLDPWPLGVPLFPRRVLRFMAKKALFWPPLGWIVRAGGGFRVDRGKRDQQAIDTAIALCRPGPAVAMFPEGPRGAAPCCAARRAPAGPRASGSATRRGGTRAQRASCSKPACHSCPRASREP